MFCFQFYFLVLLFCKNAITEFITMSFIGSAVLASGWYKWDILKDNTYCRYAECCNDRYIPYDVESKFFLLSLLTTYITLSDCCFNLMYLCANGFVHLILKYY